MKKHISYIFIILFLSASSLFAQWISLDGTTKANKPNVKVLKSDNSSLLIEISLPGIETAKRTEASKTFDVLRFPEYYTTLEIGKPQLPAIRELVGVPEFSNYKFSLVDSSIITLINYNIFPFQKPVLECEKEELIIDGSFYQKDGFYPKNIVELDKPNIWRDVKVARLSIFPVRYNPKTKTLKIYQRVVIRIDIENAAGSVFTREKSISQEWEKLFKNSIINYDFMHQSMNKDNSINTINSIGDYDYLIIAANDYLDAIQPLAQWKTRSGLLSKVVSVNDIGNNQTSIKNYISDEYYNHNIRYVLLVGDISQLSWSTYFPNLPGDYWYSLIDGGDLLPELSIGRISAISTTEVKHITNKGINYETIPLVSSWVRNVLLVAHKEGAPGKYQGCKEQIRTHDYFHDPNFITAYGASSAYGGDEATNADVNSYINSGVGVVNYRGHGNDYYWGGEDFMGNPSPWNINNEIYTTEEARDLTNGNKTPIVFSIACLNANLEYSYECLAEAFTKADYGATAILEQPDLHLQ